MLPNVGVKGRIFHWEGDGFRPLGNQRTVYQGQDFPIPEMG